VERGRWEVQNFQLNEVQRLEEEKTWRSTDKHHLNLLLLQFTTILIPGKEIPGVMDTVTLEHINSTASVK
jgi:hypothetical protein